MFNSQALVYMFFIYGNDHGCESLNCLLQNKLFLFIYMKVMVYIKPQSPILAVSEFLCFNNF